MTNKTQTAQDKSKAKYGSEVCIACRHACKPGKCLYRIQSKLPAIVALSVVVPLLANFYTAFALVLLLVADLLAIVNDVSIAKVFIWGNIVGCFFLAACIVEAIRGGDTLINKNEPSDWQTLWIETKKVSIASAKEIAWHSKRLFMTAQQKAEQEEKILDAAIAEAMECGVGDGIALAKAMRAKDAPTADEALKELKAKLKAKKSKAKKGSAKKTKAKKSKGKAKKAKAKSKARKP